MSAKNPARCLAGFACEVLLVLQFGSHVQIDGTLFLQALGSIHIDISESDGEQMLSERIARQESA